MSAAEITDKSTTDALRLLIGEYATFATYALDRHILVLPDAASDKLFEALNSRPPKMAWNPAIAGVLGVRNSKHSLPSFYWRGVPVVKLSDWVELVQ